MSRLRRCVSIVLIARAAAAVAAEPTPPTAGSTGLLLPVYAIDVPIDAAGAVDATAWAELKSAGFNAVRFPVELAQGKAAVTRVAALCAWAQAEKVSLIPVLTASPSSPLDKKLEDAAKDFARDLAETLRASDPAAYTRILMFQVGTELNHPGRNGRIETKKAMSAALDAAKGLREAERKALEVAGLSPTPLSLALSLDVPLLAAGAASIAPLADGAYALAYNSLREVLQTVAKSSDVDIVTVSWLAGSVSAGGPERFAALLQSLAADVPGKQLVLVTGVSSAFRAAAETEPFAKVVFANLAEHRASGGADAPFIGVVFHRGADTAAAASAPAGFDEARAAWTGEELAQGALAYWRGEKTAEAIAYWVSETEARLGLLGASGVTGTLAGLRQVAGIVTDPATNKAVADAVAAPTPAPTPVPTPAPGATPAANPPAEGEADEADEPNPLKDKVEAAALAALDQLLARLGTEVNETLGGTPEGQEPIGGGQGKIASVSVAGAQCTPGSVQVQQKVTCQVKLRNASPGLTASNLSIALLDADDYMLGDETMIEGVTVAPSAQATVPVTWRPTAAGSQTVRVKVYDGSYAEVGSVTAGPVNVKSGSSKPGSKTPKPGLSKPGFPWVGVLQPFGKPMKAMSGGGGSFGLPIANTSARALPPMTAAFYMDGQKVMSRSVPALLPGQSRQIVFDGVRAASGGHDLKVVIERPGLTPLSAATLRVDGLSAAGPSKRVPTRTASTRPVLEIDRVALRPSSKPSSRPTPIDIRRVPSTPAPTPTAPAGGHADLGFLGGLRAPSTARPGQNVSIEAAIVNRGTKPSGGVSVSFELFDGRGHVAARTTRRLGPIAGRSQASADWSVTLPAQGPWRVEVRLQAPGDVSGGNNTESATIRTLTVRRPIPRRR